MKRICFILWVCSCALGVTGVRAQVAYGGVPESAGMRTTPDKMDIRAFELPFLKIELPERPEKGPFYMGPVRPLVINCLKDVPVIEQNGINTVFIKIRALGAKSIGVFFEEFQLSKGARVFFHAGGHTYGNYNYRNVEFKKRPCFMGPKVDGNECVVELNIPVSEWTQNKISISSVYHYLYSEEEELDLSCNIDVNCPEGDAWCNQIRSVATFEGTCHDSIVQCSGALVNNMNQDFKQYFLTARHCTNCIDNWDAITVRFNYQKSSCGGGFADLPYRVSGAEPITDCDISWTDNALFLINEPIPAQFNVYYSGVDITARSLYDDVHVIHHPEIKPKIITSGQIQYFAGPKWDVYWNDGVVADGSSGAPVFLDENQRIIATISGGLDYDCSSAEWHDWVGKVRDCGNIEDELFKNTGAESFGGIDPILACQEHLELYGIFSDASRYRSNKHQIRIQAQNTINVSSVAESHFYPNAASFFDISNYDITAGQRVSLLPGTHVYKGAIFSARIGPCDAGDECGINYFKKAAASLHPEETKVLSGDFGVTLYPNPTQGDVWITVTGTNSPVEIALFDAVGTQIQQSLLGTQNETSYRMDISHFLPGIYFIRVKSGTHISTKRIVLIE